MKRTPLARGAKGLSRGSGLSSGSGLKRGEPLRVVSGRRRAENAADGAWTALREAVLVRDGYRCAVLWPGVVCAGHVDVHHKWPSGQGGPGICPVGWCVAACRACHLMIHTETAEARRRGLLWDGPPGEEP